MNGSSSEQFCSLIFIDFFLSCTTGFFGRMTCEWESDTTHPDCSPPDVNPTDVGKPNTGNVT